MDSSCLALGLRPYPQRLKQPHLLTIDEGLVRHQGAVKAPLLVVAPDMGCDGVGFGDCYRIIPATQAVDEGILSVNTDPDLETAVVIP